jgi:hypothetical protein
MAQSFIGVPGFGAWACDGVPHASHAAAMTAPALPTKTITATPLGSQTGFSGQYDWLD